MTEEKKTNFQLLSDIDLKDDIKKKSKYDYLPWAKAWRIMKLHDENAEVYEREFEHYDVVSGPKEDFLVKRTQYYQKSGKGSYVEVFVKMFGRTEKEIHAVTDFANKDVAEPSDTQVNKALKRAFVKALAKHGLGLYIYEGEDLPVEPKITVKELEMIEKLISKLADTMNEQGIDTDVETLKLQMIARINKIVKQEFDYLKPIKKLEEMTFEHGGLMKIEIQRGQDELKKKKK